MQNTADASTETPDATDGATKAQPSHPVTPQLLKELNDPASRKADLEKALKEKDASIASAEQPSDYWGQVDETLLDKMKKQKAALEKEMDELLTETALNDGMSKTGASNANPPLTNSGKPDTGGHAPSAPPTSTAADLKMDDRWLEEQAVTKKAAERDAQKRLRDIPKDWKIQI